MRISIFSTVFILSLLCTGIHAQNRERTYRPVMVDSVKVWNSNMEVLEDIPYKSYKTRLLKNIDEFTAEEKPLMTKYGSDPRYRYEATGFYRTQKIDGRWWLIDPEGYPQIARYVNDVRPGRSPRNVENFNLKFKTESNWMSTVSKDFENLGFNGMGSWTNYDLLFATETPGNIQGGTIILDFIESFKPRVNNVAPIFDPEFPAHCDNRAKSIVTKYKNEKDLLGYFTDNEMPFRRGNLESYLSIEDPNDPNRLAVEAWFAQRGKTKEQITTEDRLDFLGFLTDRYYSITSSAIRKYDPNHLVLGSRLQNMSKFIPQILQSESRHCDICSINNYEMWEPTTDQLKIWEDNLTIPFMITEFYSKAADSGLPNVSGHGNFVQNQTDRAYYFQTFCLKLLESKSCVGWHWYKYLDNDPEDEFAGHSNRDSNKGIYNNSYEMYQPLGQYMKELNRNVYRLIDFFDYRLEKTEDIHLEPVADTYVARSADDQQTRGEIKRFVTRHNMYKDYQYEGLLRFNLANYQNKLNDYNRIVLKIYGGKGGNKEVEVHGLTSNNWEEKSLTGNQFVNDPMLSGDNLIATLSINPEVEQYYEIDVTAFVQQRLSNNTEVSFRISDKAMGNTTALSTEFHTKEADSNRPVLSLIKNANAELKLSDVKIDNELYPEFTQYKQNYHIKLPYTSTSVPQISAVSSSGSVMEIKQAQQLHGTVNERTASITIQDKAENPKNFKVYTFTFEVIPPMDLFLLIGQSNMAGRGYLSEDYHFNDEESIYLFNDKSVFEKAANPLNQYSNIRKDFSMQQLGPGFAFARKYAEYAGNNTPIGLIVNARGGSSIEQWKKGSNDGLFEKTMERVREAQKWGTVRAILWHQGESDKNSESYISSLSTFITDLRQALGSNALFVAGEIAQWGSPSNFNQNLPKITEVGNATYVKSDGLSPLIDETDAHFDAKSQIVLGERYAKTVYFALHPEASTDFSAIYEFTKTKMVNSEPEGVSFSTYEAVKVTPASILTYFPCKGWPTYASVDKTRYNEFTITPEQGYMLSLQELCFDHMNYSENGPAHWTLRSSLDDYKTDLGTNVIATDWKTEKIVLGDSFANLTTPVTFRLYAFKAKSENGSWYNDNILIKGNTKPYIQSNTNVIQKKNDGLNISVNNSKIQISCSWNGYFVSVHDLSGRQLFNTGEIRTNNYEIPLSLKKQIYLIRVYNREIERTEKIYLTQNSEKDIKLLSQTSAGDHGARFDTL